MTEAMSNLVDITAERRKIQNGFNLKNNIQPKTILKSVDEIMFSTAVADSQKENSNNKDFLFDNLGLLKEDKVDMVNSLKQAMAISAEELDFEKAAKIRDEIKEIEATF